MYLFVQVTRCCPIVPIQVMWQADGEMFDCQDWVWLSSGYVFPDGWVVVFLVGCFCSEVIKASKKLRISFHIIHRPQMNSFVEVLVSCHVIYTITLGGKYFKWLWQTLLTAKYRRASWFLSTCGTRLLLIELTQRATCSAWFVPAHGWLWWYVKHFVNSQQWR